MSSSDTVDALQAAVEALKLLNQKNDLEKQKANASSPSIDLQHTPPASPNSTPPHISPDSSPDLSPVTSSRSGFISAQGPRRVRNMDGFTLSPHRAAVHTIPVTPSALQQSLPPLQMEQTISCTVLQSGIRLLC